MNITDKQDNWHAIFVLTGDEDNVKARLEYRFHDELKILVPKRKLRERKNGIYTYVTRTLFPGYVLINGSIRRDNIQGFYNVPGLLRVLKSGYEVSKIDESEIKVLSSLICNDEIIGISNVFIENSKVRVVDGPLVALEGFITEINHRKGRAKVKLNFLGEERCVELGVNVIRPVDI